MDLSKDALYILLCNCAQLFQRVASETMVPRRAVQTGDCCFR